jgi:hypothetical protein
MSKGDELLSTMRVFDKRKMTKPEELWEVAKLYNVKARVWSSGIPLRRLDKKIYNQIRSTAVVNLLEASRPVTIEEVCSEIERLIDEGHCGLERRVLHSSSRRHQW